MNRILWNVRGGDIDEIVIQPATSVHVEQMNDRCWWIGIDLPDGGYWAGNFHCDSRGRMRFTEQEHEGFVWDDDDAHDEQTPPVSALVDVLHKHQLIGERRQQCMCGWRRSANDRDHAIHVAKVFEFATGYPR